MNILPNGCRYSDFNVFPNNWNTSRASLKKTWRIEYRFYDPAFTTEFPKGKLKVIKNGINRINELAERQQIVNELLRCEEDLLKNQGYNPITDKRNKQVPEVEAQTYPPQIIPIDDRSLSTQQYLAQLDELLPLPDTPFISALWLGLKRTKAVPQSINDIGSVIRGTEVAAKQLGYNQLPIKEIRKRHMKLILEKCAVTNKRWSNGRHNDYKGYLRKVFKPLVALEVIEMNPMTDIEQLTETQNIREVLTLEDRQRIDAHLHKNHYNFWRFIQIFFHSGARETELMQVRVSDVDLVKQQYKLLIKKGRVYRWVPKPIKDIAVPFWKEVLDECKELETNHPAAEEIYLFSKFLQPGLKPIRPDQIGRRWNKYVRDKKTGLGIDKDFYSLKHLHTTEMIEILQSRGASIEQAEKAVADHCSHTTTTMVRNVYDINNQSRKDDLVKKVSNKFA